MQHRAGSAVGDVGEQQFQIVLPAVEALNRQDVLVVGPVDARYVNIVMIAQVDPHRVAGSDIDHPDLDDGVLFAHLGIFQMGGHAVVGQFIQQGEAFHPGLIGVPEGDPAPVRRPAIGVGTAELLFVYPVEYPVEDILRAVGGEGFRLPGFHVGHVKIVMLGIGHVLAVGGKRNVLQLRIILCQRDQRFILDIIQIIRRDVGMPPDLPLGAGDQQMILIAGGVIFTHLHFGVGAGLEALILPFRLIALFLDGHQLLVGGLKQPVSFFRILARSNFFAFRFDAVVLPGEFVQFLGQGLQIGAMIKIKRSPFQDEGFFSAGHMVAINVRRSALGILPGKGEGATVRQPLDIRHRTSAELIGTENILQSELLFRLRVHKGKSS